MYSSRTQGKVCEWRTHDSKVSPFVACRVFGQVHFSCLSMLIIIFSFQVIKCTFMKRVCLQSGKIGGLFHPGSSIAPVNLKSVTLILCQLIKPIVNLAHYMLMRGLRTSLKLLELNRGPGSCEIMETTHGDYHSALSDSALKNPLYLLNNKEGSYSGLELSKCLPRVDVGTCCVCSIRQDCNVGVLSYWYMLRRWWGRDHLTGTSVSKASWTMKE